MPEAAMLTTRKGVAILISECDRELLSRFDWLIEGTGRDGRRRYAYTTALIDGVKKKIKMHRLIMKPTDWQVVDHIDGDGLDNRRENLRNCSLKENAQNRRTPTSPTGFFGCMENSGGFLGTVTLDGVQYSIARYPTAEEAAIAHDRATLFYKPEFGSMNFRDRGLKAASIEDLREEAKNTIARTAVSKGGTSVFNGVVRRKESWGSYIAVGGRQRSRQHYLGQYSTEEAAAEAFDSAAKYFASKNMMNKRLALNFMDRDIAAKNPAELRRGCHFGSPERYSSKFMGVSRAYKGQWQVGIKVEYKPQHLAIVKDEEEAARIYDAVARSLGFSSEKLNFPDQDIEPMTVEQARERYHKFKRRPNGFAIPEIATLAVAD